ncbi:non-hemolytic enterotoxin b [Fictibacillus macauensis ZFHKF-1]|uniref:Non-hemolytic enterotoxin b n=1 Tax=Fictibacillus macauensis ZFHKF-1 TaxID=1196324 RepID=I8AH38_9BACL|nr:HBL/NHE enterotoxin family protein [Fictibacillus macauensis]EIT84744.1 non-hemolytic enterotoxin b [Fictibacillus macauensis ZFHKF-1]
MSKKPYKVMTVTALAAALFTGSVVPAYAATNDAPAAVKSVKAAAQKEVSYQLGPDGLREALAETGNHTIVMDLYALSVLKQANITLNGVTSIDDTLKGKINSHQSLSKANANFWLDTVKPHIVQTNQNIVNYDTKFSTYYNTLIKAVDDGNKKTLETGLTKLKTEISGNQEEVENLIQELQSFRNKLSKDTQSFKDDANEVTAILASEDAGIPLLENQITTYNKTVRDLNGAIIGSAVATAIGPLAIVGGAIVIATGVGTPLGVAIIAGGAAATVGGTVGIVLATKARDEAQESLKNVTKELSNAKLQVGYITNVKNQLGTLTDTIDQAITSLEAIKTQWSRMDSKYTSLIKNVKTLDPEDLDFIKEDLEVSKKSWNDVKTYADNLFQQNNVKVTEAK